MKKSLHFRTLLQNLLILLSLGILILIPRPMAGKIDLDRAIRYDQSGEYSQAASGYTAAAERQPWMFSLREKAGDAFLLSNDNEKASEAYLIAFNHGALSAKGFMLWGDTALRMNDPNSAIARWKKALQSGGSPTELLRRIALGYESLQDFPNELQAWQKYTALQPDDAAAQYRLGLLLASDSPAESLPHLAEAAKIDPTLDPAVQLLRTALNTGLLSDEAAYRYVISGRALGALQEWRLAEISFRNAIRERPAYAEAWGWLAEAEQQQNRDGTAEIQRAVSLNPDSAMVQGLYGFYLQRQKMPVKALGAFRIAASLEPADPGWEIAVGKAYEQTDDLVEALAHYQHAVELAPKDPSTWRTLADVSLRDGGDQIGVGLPAALESIELAKDDWQSVDVAGQLLFELQDMPGAEAMLKKAVELGPNQAAPLLHLGILYLQIGNRPAAQACLQQAKDLDPQGSQGWQAQRLLEQYFP
jgi:tetratricopeptide (TPR) repeat protein